VKNSGRIVLVGIVLAFGALPALAVEQALGRTLPGLWVMPQGGVVPAEAGFSFTMMPVGYMGKISGGTEVPIGGQLYGNVHADVSENLLVPQYVYKTELTKVSLSSSFYLPVNWIGLTATTHLNGSPLAKASSSTSGLADVFFTPLTVGIHFSENNNLAISTRIFAPTGPYHGASLSSLGMAMNEWTIEPNVTHTFLWKKRGMEFDNYIGFDIYSENPTTRYTSGTVFNWAGMVVQYFSPKFGVGAVVSNITQISNDTGPLTNRLHGFRLNAWGTGPTVLYVAKAKNPSMTLQFRWVDTFTATNTVKGNALMFGVTFGL